MKANLIAIASPLKEKRRLKRRRRKLQKILSLVKRNDLTSG